MASTSGRLLILSGPSGSGKTSLSRRLAHEVPGLCISISYTTRPRRANERAGIDYLYTTKQHFQTMIEAGQLMEYAEVFGHHYGTASKQVQQQQDTGTDVLLEIDWQGAQQVRNKYPDSIGIFLLPPDFQALRQRLLNRGQDQNSIEKRTDNALLELDHYHEYQYTLINDNFEHTLQELKRLIHCIRNGTPQPPPTATVRNHIARLRQEACTSPASGPAG